MINTWQFQSGEHSSVKTEFKKGMTPWNKGSKGLSPGFNKHHTEESKRKISVAKSGKTLTAEHKQKISEGVRRIMTPQHIKKCLQKNSQSSLEKKFQQIIDSNSLPYKFVGDGSFILGGKCPDFININGEKKAIEVYFRRHKQEFRNGLEAWKKQRNQIFNKFGWELIFLDETQVNDTYVLSILPRNELKSVKS